MHLKIFNIYFLVIASISLVSAKNYNVQTFVSNDEAKENLFNKTRIYIDESVQELNVPINTDDSVLQLFSHGREGQLFLDGQWRDAPAIATWIEKKDLPENITHMNIYGCNFAKGEQGKAAVTYLSKTLGISIAASDDLTGIDGDWELEVGPSKNSIKLEDYAYNLQGYIDCATIINSSFDYLHEYNSYSKTHNGYTYFAGGYNYDPASPPSYPIINGNPYDPAHVGPDGEDLYIAIWDPNCNQVLGTFIGGSDLEFVDGLDIDSDGNLFILGETSSTDFPTTDGSTFTDSYDKAFVLKIAPDGTLLFSSIFGSNSNDMIVDKIIVEGNHFYVLGTNQASDFPTTNGSSAANALRSPFVRKYNTNGSLVYSSTWGSDDQDNWPEDMVPLSNGGVAVIGRTSSQNGSFPTTDGTTGGASQSTYLTILDDSGNISFSTLFGISGNVKGGGVVVDDNDNIYLAGEVWGTITTTDGSTNAAFDDIFIRKYDSTGNLLFSTLLAGSSADNYNDMKFSNGMLYLMGNTSSSDFPIVNGNPHAGSTDMLLAKLDPSGNVIFATLYGGSLNENVIYSFEVNNAGEIFTLLYSNYNPPTTDGSTGQGFTVAKFNTDGSLCAATILPFGNDVYFSDGIEASGDTLRIVGGIRDIPGTYSTDGTINTGTTTLNQGLWVGKYVFCPSPTPITSDVLSPSTINVCQNGIIDQINGEEVVIDGSSLPPIYIDGVLSDQPDIALYYQWQSSASAGGPWTDVPGSIGKQQNYTPAPTLSNVYYRRIAKTSECCGGITASTSNVVSILVGGNIAPTANAGGIFYTCAGNAVTIGASPAATGGTAPYTYSWDNGAYTTPNPSVSPTQSTVYTLVVTDNNGCRHADQATVNIYNADAGADMDACAGAGVTIGGAALSGINTVPVGAPSAGIYNIAYDWTPKNGTLSCTDCPNPMASPTISTDYTLEVTIYQPNGSSCTTSDIVTVGIVDAPVGPLAITDTVVCLGDMIELSTLPTPLNWPSIAAVSQTDADGGFTASVANLTDGNFATGGRTTNGAGHHITIDLGSTETINTLQLGRLGTDIGYDFNIEISTDNVSFTDLGFRIRNSNSSSSAVPPLSNVQLSTYQFDKVSARYVRLSSNFSYRDAAISEFYATYDYTYIWTPGAYINTYGASATFDAGNIIMPNPNPIAYTVSASLGTCNFYDQVTVAAIEARAGEDGCGPRYIGLVDRTPNINETYSWAIITDPAITTGTGNFIGPTNRMEIPVSASTGGDVGYELTTTYTFNGSTGTKKDTVLVTSDCGLLSCDISTGSGGDCPDFDSGSITLIAEPHYNTNPADWTFSWTSSMGMVGLDSYTNDTVQLTDNVTRTYTVTMTSLLDPSYSCTESIDVNSPSFSDPVFSVNSSIAACSGVAINIGDPANNPGLTYEWSNAALLDDAAISNPEATVLATTEFTVTVTDDVSGCNVEHAVEVIVPQVAYAGTDLLVCDNGTVTIGSPAISGYTYSWAPAGADWRNGTNQNDAQPDVFVAITQDFYLTVTDDSGTCTSIDTIAVLVESLPPTFTLPDLSYCPSQSAPLVLGTNNGGTTGTNLVPNGYSYSWSPGTVSNASIQNPTVNTPLPTSSLTYNIEIANPGGCRQVAIQTINPILTPPSTISDQTICLGDAITIGDDTNPTGGGISYSWSPSTNLDDATAINPTFTASSTGTFTYVITKTESGCVNTAEVTITVNELTAPTLSAYTICSGEEVEIGTAENPLLSYNWSPSTDLDDPFIANPTFTGSSTTNYTLTVIDGTGCTAEAGTAVSVNPPPTYTVNAPDMDICYQTTTSLPINASVSPAGSYAYNWSPTIYLDNPSVLTPTFFVPGEGIYEYTLEVIDQTTGCSTYTPVVVTTGVCTEICGDGLDNDGDGLIDNADGDCCGAKAPTLSKR